MSKLRRKRNVMMAYPFEERRLESYQKPYIIQPKLDGIRCLATCDGNTVQLETSTGVIINTVPHIKTILCKLPIQNQIIFDGELYIHGNFQQLCSIVKRNHPIPEHINVEYHIFDIYSEDKQSLRIGTVNSIVGPYGKIVKTVPNVLCNTFEEISECLVGFYEQEYEGIIIRHQGTNYMPRRTIEMMKWKPTRSDHYKIVGFKQEHTQEGEPKDSLGAFIVQDDQGEVFSVGSGFTQRQREDFWKVPSAYIGKIVEVKYQELTNFGIPRFPVFMRIV